MSKIPTPTKIPKVNNSSLSKDFADADHEQLLRKIWKDLDSIAKNYFSLSKKSWDKAVQEKTKKFREDIELAASTAISLSKRDKYISVKTELQDISDRLTKRLDKPLPVPNPELWTVEVIERSLVEEIFAEPTGYTQKQAKVVGFVDISATVTASTGLELDDGIPFELSGEESEFAEQLRTPQDFASLAREAFDNQSWRFSARTTKLWIDVRTQAVPAGQLLRELKTLRSYSDDAEVLVAMKVADKQLIEMLRHEGFGVILESDLQ